MIDTKKIELMRERIECRSTLAPNKESVRKLKSSQELFLCVMRSYPYHASYREYCNYPDE